MGVGVSELGLDEDATWNIPTFAVGLLNLLTLIVDLEPERMHARPNTVVPHLLGVGERHREDDGTIAVHPQHNIGDAHQNRVVLSKFDDLPVAVLAGILRGDVNLPPGKKTLCNQPRNRGLGDDKLRHRLFDSHSRLSFSRECAVKTPYKKNQGFVNMTWQD